MKHIAFKFHAIGSASLIAALFWAGGGTIKAAGEADWKKTVEAAKKEGRLTIYTESSQTSLLVDSRAFQKKFPEMRGSSSRGSRWKSSAS